MEEIEYADPIEALDQPEGKTKKQEDDDDLLNKVEKIEREINKMERKLEKNQKGMKSVTIGIVDR